jgi:hypothetical protein
MANLLSQLTKTAQTQLLEWTKAKAEPLLTPEYAYLTDLREKTADTYVHKVSIDG